MSVLKRLSAIFIVCAVILTNAFVVSAETVNIELDNSLKFSSGGAYLTCTSDNYIFAATGSSAKLSYEVSVYDKETLEFLTTITASSPSTVYLNVNAMHVKGDYLYVAYTQRSGNGNPMSRKYNIKEIYKGQSIAPVKTVGMRPKAYSFMNDDILCRTDSGYQNITFMNIENLEDMSAIGVSNDNAATLKAYTKVYISNNILYGVYGKTLYIYDATYPLSGVSRQDSQVFKGTVTPGLTSVTALSGMGNYLYAGTSEGIYVLDMTDAEEPSNLGLVSGTANSRTIEINNGYMYVATSSELKIFDLSNAESPSLVYTMATSSAVNSIHLRPGKLYTGTNNGIYVYNVSGLDVLETTTPGSDAEVGEITYKKTIEGIEDAEKVCIGGNYLFVLNSDKTEISAYDKETYSLIKTISSQKDGVNLTINNFYCNDGYLCVSYDGILRKYNLANLSSATLKEEAVIPMFSDMSRDMANIIAETDNYIFVAATDNANRDMLANGKVFVYNKENYEYVTSIHIDSGNTNYDLAVRSMWARNNKLYVTFNNVKTSTSYAGSLSGVLSDNSRSNSPLCAYNVETIAKNAVLKPEIICSNSEIASLSHPYNRGGSAYLDEEKAVLYQGIYTVASGQNYKAYDLSGNDETLKLTLKNGSYDCVKFTVKDNYLFEILQNNGGLFKADTTTQSYNKVLVYDIAQKENETEIDLSERVIGSYQTQIYGDNVINDVAFDGKNIYIATTGGVDVVAFEGLNKKASLLDGKRVNSLKVDGNLLFMSHNGGVNVYSVADGVELIDEYAYSGNVYNMAVNSGEGKLYITSSRTNGYGAVLKYADISSGKIKGNIPVLKTVDNTYSALSTTAWVANTGQMIAENDKYIFVVMARSGYTTCGVLQIFDKNDGSLLTTISEPTSNATRYRGIRNIHVKDDILYIMWGNGYNGGEAQAYVLGTTMSPLKAYDVSSVQKDSTLSGITVYTGGQRTAAHAPYIAGNISYLDDENGKLIVSEVMNASYDSRYYYIYNTSDIKAAVKAGSASGLTRLRFKTGGLSRNAVKFLYKDGWLYELLQSKAGLSDYSCNETLVDSSGNVLNNMVRVYDLNNVTLTSEDQLVESCLKGTYVTETAGAKAIRDIEVIGDCLYVSTPAGVETVSLANVKNAETAVALTSENTIKGNGGARDLDSIGNMLYVAFEGPESFKGPNSTSQPGEVVAYNTANNALHPETAAKQVVAYGAHDISVNKAESAVYVLNDTMGPPSMTAYSFGSSSPMFGMSADDISFEYIGSMILENINSYFAVVGNSYIITGTGDSAESIDKLLVYSASSKLKTVEITKDAGEITNLLVCGSYFYTYDGKILSCYKIPTANSSMTDCLIGTYEASGEIIGLCANGSDVYLATKSGLVILNVTSVTNGTLTNAKTVFDGEELTAVSYANSYIYGAKVSGELFVYDVTNYTVDAISEVDNENVVTELVVSGSEIYGVTESGKVLLYETNEDVVIKYDVDIITPKSKTLKGESQLKGFPYIEFEERVYSTHNKVVANDKYVVTAGVGNVNVYDGNLSELFTIDATSVVDMYINGDTLILADLSGELRVKSYDLSGETVTSNEIVSLSGSGLAATGKNSIWVYDKAESSLYEYSYDGNLLKSVSDFNESVTKLYHDGTYLYSVNANTAKIYDVSAVSETASAADIYMTKLETVQKITALETVDGYLYVSTNGGNSTEGGNSASNRLYVYNLASISAETSTLSYVSTYSTSTSEQGGGKITDFASKGDFLVIDAIDSKQIQIVNIKDKANPYLESMIKKGAEDSYSFSDIAVSRDKVYAISSSGGLCVYNYKSVDISEIEFVSEEKTSLTPSGESLSAKVHIYNESGETVNATLYLAVYDVENARTLKKIEMSEITAENGAETISETFEIEKGSSSDVLVKAMLFDKKTQKPLCEFSQPINASKETDVTLYVDSDADASVADGTEAAPFKTIEDAKEAVRKINRQMSGDITVIISGGRYELSEPITFDEADSGFNGYKVIYKAAEGETPVISGGRKIEGWTLYDSENGIYSAPANGINTRQLVVNGERAVRARSKGGLTNASTDGGAIGIYCYDDFIADYENIQDLELVFIGSFLSKRIGVDNAYKLDSSGRTLLAMNRPFWQYPNSFEYYILPVYYENALELLDEENEFYLDTRADKFYYKPRAGENINASSVVAPVLEELLVVEGSGLYDKVRNIEFSGIEFSDTTWMGPTEDGGFYPTQAGHYIMPTYGSAALNSNLTTDSISIINAENISINSCVMKNFGGNGVKVKTSSSVTLKGNKMTDVSAGGIYVGEIEKVHANPDDERKLVNDILIENNYLDNIACEYFTSCAIALGTVQNTSVTHNEISNTPYTAVHIGWGWNSLPARNITGVNVEYNYIHDVMLSLGDGGAIYTTGYTLADAETNPNRIANNHIGRVEGNTVFSGAAIYLDTGSSGWRISQNVVDLTESCSTWIPKWATGNSANIFDGNFSTTAHSGATATNTTVSETADWNEDALKIIENAGLTDEYSHIKD